jgi:SAM-dependent methyltransferase
LARLERSDSGCGESLGVDDCRMSPARLDFNSVALAYDSWFDGEGRLIFAIETRAFQSLLPLLPGPWLEIGVGSGRFAEALGIETGIDPSIKLLTMARRRGICGFLGRGEQIPFSEGTFGTAFVIVTLCFLDAPLAVLGETHRILRPGGKVVLGLVLCESPWGRFYTLKKREGHRFYTHATFYSYDEVVGLLRQVGFDVERVISTLFQRPGEVQHMEEPCDGVFGDAGFTIVVGRKLEPV